MQVHPIKASLLHFGIFVISVIIWGCSARPRSYQVASEPSQLPVQSPTNEMPTGIFDARSKGAAEAWRQFTQGGRFKVAQRKDFKIPEAAIQNAEHRDDIERAIKFAYVGEDINRDGVGGDRAFIVVDTTRDDAARFGLVIFNGLENEESIPEPCWVFRETDLSKTVMSWTRGQLVVVEYHDDGTKDLCRISWDGSRGEYSCK